MNSFPVYQVLFYFFSGVLIIASLCVVTSRNTIYGVLALVLAFFCSALLWMLLQTEFLALMLIFVYVGAVMTLLLFVVMMLNIDLEKIREKFTHFLPVAIVVLALLVVILSLAFHNHYLRFLSGPNYPADYSNTTELGTLLFTRYLYPFEIAGMILLVAMISAISLAFFGRKSGTKTQSLSEQHLATKQTRLTVVKMQKPENL